MNRRQVVKEIVRIARLLKSDDDNLLDGAKNREARNLVNKLLSKVGKGLYKDQYWKGIKEIWDIFNEAGIDWELVSAEYRKDREGRPVSKDWKFEIKFMNDKGRPTILHGTATASGAGSVKDPLDKYDVTVNVF